MPRPGRLGSLPNAIIREMEKVLREAGERVQTRAQVSITEGSVSGKNHVVSAPGSPPNNDTGVLADGIETVRMGPLHLRVQSTADYGAALELGTSRMAARPYMAPARDAERAPTRRDLAKAFNQAVRRHFRK